MWRLAGRNAVVVGAVFAALLLTMQLQAEGARGYDLSDVVSIVLFAVPALVQRVRPMVDHAPRHRAPGDRLPPSTLDSAAPIAAPAAAPRRASTVETVIAHAVAVIIAGGAYAVALALVVLQAWTAALAALIVCAIALAGLTGEPRRTA